jgi:hypothetical protein
LNNIKLCLHSNPKKFWAFAKANNKNTTKSGGTFASSATERASIFNTYFQSMFTHDGLVTDLDPDTYGHNVIFSDNTTETQVLEQLSEIHISVKEVESCLNSIDITKASGPDCIPGQLLKLTAAEIAPSLTRLFNLSLKLGEMPVSWKQANINPIHKKGDSYLVENYRPISLLCIVSKLMEKCVYMHCYNFISERLYDLQHGFQRGKNCTTQLLHIYHNIISALDKRMETHAVHLDFSKAFYKVSHKLLLHKMISGLWFRRLTIKVVQ